jgi:hypothetical protein
LSTTLTYSRRSISFRPSVLLANPSMALLLGART